MNSDNIIKLKQGVLSNNIYIGINSSDKLVKIGGDDVVDFFITLLQSENARIRNLAAASLGRIGNDRAVPALVDAIDSPKNKKNTGSLVYALTNFDCKDYFLFLINVALTYSYESQNHALDILGRQSFNVSNGDIKLAKEKVDNYLSLADKCEDYEVLLDDLTNCIKRIEEQHKSPDKSSDAHRNPEKRKKVPKGKKKKKKKCQAPKTSKRKSAQK